MMLEIRRANFSDIPAVADIVQHHFDSTGFSQEITLDPELVGASLVSFLLEPKFNLLVVLDGEQVVGALGLQVSSLLFSLDLLARELFLFIEPAYRGQHATGRLMVMAEAWAKSLGATTFIIGDHALSPDYVGAIYERRGYRKAQTDYIKRI